MKWNFEMFMNATRNKFRYDSVIGLISTEDLFDLPLLTERTSRACLNDVAVRISRDLKALGEESFVANRTSPAKALLQQKLDVVRAVIDVKQAENAEATARAAAASQKSKLDELIARKKDDTLAQLSVEELEALRSSL